MTIEEVIYDRLATDATVAALVGTRIYPYQAPESEEFPYLIYSEVESNPHLNHDGAGQSDRYTMDIEAWGTTPASARALATATRNELHAYRGSHGGQWVQGIFLRGQSGEHDQPPHAEERGLFAIRMNFEIWYRAA